MFQQIWSSCNWCRTFIAVLSDILCNNFW